MRPRTLLRRSLLYYWPVNLAVVCGVAAAVAVLAGALLVGDSVRASLRDLVLSRLGNTQAVITADVMFRERLAGSFADACPMIALDGALTHQASGRRAAGVLVYGVDQRFWRFHHRSDFPLSGREALAGESLAAEIGAQDGDTLLLRLDKPSDIPAESLHGRKDAGVAPIRLTLKARVGPAELGDFSLKPRQGLVRTLFVPLVTLQRELRMAGRVNSILVGPRAQDPAQTLRASFALEDLGVRVRPVRQANALQVDILSGLLPDALADAARKAGARMGLRPFPILTYLANRISIGGRDIPYSVMSALDLNALPEAAFRRSSRRPIVLNQWAARELKARPGNAVGIGYFVWGPQGELLTRSDQFELAAIVPLRELAADRQLVPEYPGLTDALNVRDWEPPFPMDLSRIRRADEEYWDRYRATPKAFIPLQRGQQLWGSRFGKLTAIRLEGTSDPLAYAQRLRSTIDPLSAGFALWPVRAEGLRAAAGVTDLSEYFVYFSFFLMASALLLAGLFFRLGLEQRLRSVGLLEAVGFPARRVKRLFLMEGLLLSLAGGLLGAAGAAAYAWLMVAGLGSWWLDAVGAKLITVHLNPRPLGLGVAGGVAASWMAIWWTLRAVRRFSPRHLLAGGGVTAPTASGRWARLQTWAGAILLALGLAVLLLSSAGRIALATGFFGAGTLLLAALLEFLGGSLSWRPKSGKSGAPALLRLAWRSAGHRPGRTVLSAALVASATFIIIAVEAFRWEPQGIQLHPRSGSGGFTLMAESQAPLYYNPESPTGRENLNLGDLERVKFVSFRLRPGDDASCLNLYVPRNPRILGASSAFVRAGRFRFAQALAKNEEQQQNPWLLLETSFADGATPAIADGNSLAYVLHRKVGENLLINISDGAPVRLRLVAALADSVLQSEIVISEAHFLRLFPRQQGYRFFLIDAPPEAIAEAAGKIESALAGPGVDVVSTADRLAAFHRVENTYLSTFQALGAMGLLLGTIGLAAVLFRNVFERRSELALLAAVGYRRVTLQTLVICEHVFVLAAGLVAGTVCALLAIAPAIGARHAEVPVFSLAVLLLAVAAVGVLASVGAIAIALRMPLLGSLRAE